MTLRIWIAAALLATAPVSAIAAPGVVRNTVTLRAGPGTEFPAVDRIPAGARVNIHGCIRGGAWCDVSYAGERGWVAATSLAYLYGRQYVYLPDYVDDVPIVPFVVASYWGSYYIGRPWYHRHAYWNRYWHHHPPLVAYGPRQHPDFAGQTGAGVTPQPNVAGPGAHPFPPGGFAQRGYGAGGTVGIGHRVAPQQFGGVQPGTPLGARFAPGSIVRPTVTPHFAQPNIVRPSAAPLAARAQINAPRAPIGGVPQIGGVPRIGGGAALGVAPHIGSVGGPRGGGPGHPH
ncbi:MULTISPECIES: SH3 domain-containing protein [unclassified Bradyrhizobium]|uniref:SH3 domain-containing protein n=1 Tax=unclassified Bradyrhizobium TaxID=2631580 RepID=UPI0028E7D49E|nr:MULTISPECIES: SH3 domain-containing protein [unclassified Bradyrhizobium]